LNVEIGIEIEWWNDFSELSTNHIKWCGVTINHSERFRTLSYVDRKDFHNQCTFFNSFVVRWRKSNLNQYEYIPLNPYSMTLQSSLNKIQQQLQTNERFMNGQDEMYLFSLLSEECDPPIRKEIDNDKLLNDIYYNCNHYPNITVTWVIDYDLMVPYERTIEVERIGKEKEKEEKEEKEEEEEEEELDEMKSSPTLKIHFNPFFVSM